MTGSAARNERCEAASHAACRPSVAPCVAAGSTCRKVPPVAARAHSAAAPARLCSRHPNTSRWCTTRAWQALAGGSSARVTHAVGTRGAVGATPRQLDVPRSADIICKVCLQDLVCPDVCLQDLSDRESCRNSTAGCALTCALRNHAYGASVPAGGVCLQGQNDGIQERPPPARQICKKAGRTPPLPPLSVLLLVGNDCMRARAASHAQESREGRGH